MTQTDTAETTKSLLALKCSKYEENMLKIYGLYFNIYTCGKLLFCMISVTSFVSQPTKIFTRYDKMGKCVSLQHCVMHPREEIRLPE